MKEMWAAVVLQAASDLDSLDYYGLNYAQAHDFFFAPGPWLESRQQIADFLELHAQDIERLGRQTLAARHARDGGPKRWSVVSGQRSGARQPAAAPCPLPVIPAPPRPARQARQQVEREKNWWIQKFMTRRQP